MNKRAQQQWLEAPPSELALVVVERTRVSTENASVQVTDLRISAAARRGLNLAPKREK